MPTCKKCGDKFPNRKIIDGKERNLHKRSYCFKCSPFGKHNTVQIHIKHKINPKYCKICGILITIENAYKKGNTFFYGLCKKCFKQNIKDRFKKNKLWSIKYLGGKCQKCGYDRNYSALEFHHKYEKLYNLNRLMYCSFEKRKKELDKCALLCANCHRELHHPNTLMPV